MENEKFLAQIHYSKETVMKLSNAIYNTYGVKTKLAVLLCSVLLAVIGISCGLDSAVGLCLTAVACLLLSQTQYPAAYKARRVIEAFGGNLPRIQYKFCENGFVMYIGEQMQEYSYSVLIKLVEEKQFLYLFPDEKSTFMIEKTSVQPGGDGEELKRFLTNRTGLSWEKPRSLLMLRLPSLFKTK